MNRSGGGSFGSRRPAPMVSGTVQPGMGKGIRDLDKAEWAALYKRVLQFARTRAGPARAEEITQEAFSRVLTTRPWNEESGSSLFDHMTGIVSSLLSHERTSKRAEVEHAAAAEWVRPTGGVAPSAEDESLSREAIRRREQESSAAIGDVVKRLAGSPQVLAVISAWLDGITKPSAIAEHTNIDVDEVYLAIQRIRRYGHSLEPGARPKKELS